MNKQHEWDLYFMRLAKTVSTKSKCLSRRIGAVLVEENHIISTGWNGAPKGVKECNERPMIFYSQLEETMWGKNPEQAPIKCPRRYFNYKSGQGLHLCQASHAEVNALIQSNKLQINSKSILYVYVGQICKNCVITMINKGVKTLVYLDGCPAYDSYSEVLLKESGIVVRKIKESDLNG